MRKIFLVFIVLFMGGCTSYKPDFNIGFGSGFKQNSVNLSINDRIIFKDRILNSDTVTGIAGNTFLVFEKDSLKLLNESLKTEKMVGIKPERFLNIIVEIDKKPYYLQADLIKGNNIFIDKHLFYYNVNLRQFKKKVKIY